MNGNYHRKCDNLVSRKICDETVIVPVANNVGSMDSLFALNELASVIWDLLDGKTGTGEIVERICAEYDVSPENAARDVAAFVSHLEELGLVAALREAR